MQAASAGAGVGGPTGLSSGGGPARAICHTTAAVIEQGDAPSAKCCARIPSDCRPNSGTATSLMCRRGRGARRRAGGVLLCRLPLWHSRKYGPVRAGARAAAGGQLPPLVRFSPRLLAAYCATSMSAAVPLSAALPSGSGMRGAKPHRGSGGERTLRSALSSCTTAGLSAPPQWHAQPRFAGWEALHVTTQGFETVDAHKPSPACRLSSSEEVCGGLW